LNISDKNITGAVQKALDRAKMATYIDTGNEGAASRAFQI